MGKAIETALEQTYPNIEVIVIDDGSTDGSVEVIRSFGSRVRWEAGPNQGGCAARNRGIEIATGTWVQFLDVDDLLFRDKVEQMLRLPDLGFREIAFSDFRIRNQIFDCTRTSPRPRGDSTNFRYILDAERLQTAAPLYPRNALLEIGAFDVALPCAQEYDLNLRLALEGWRFRRLPVELYEVRMRAGSVSFDYTPVLRHQDAIFQKLVKRNRGYALPQAELFRLLSWRYVRNARLLTRLGDDEGAWLAVARAKELGISVGIKQAFSWKSRGFAYLLGPVLAERVVQRLVYTSRRIRGPQDNVRVEH